MEEHRMFRPTLVVLGLLTAGGPALAGAQSLDSVPESQAGSPHEIRWWHGAAAAGGISTLMLLDHPVQRFAQDNRGSGSDNVAKVVRHFGQPEVYGTVTLGLVATGLIAHQPNVARAGGRLALSLILAGGAVEAGKTLFGRPRPEQSLDADGFSPFSGQASLPSGHSAAAFALATSLADDIHRPWATVGLYGMASAVAWSRLNDNRHWFSDVAAGALVGITSAKLASGRWRVFGLHPPSIIAGPGTAGLGWRAQF
jgi:membrane-associated phospholipid phosphatase